METDPLTVQQTFVFLPDRDNIRIFKKFVFFSPVDHVGTFRAEVMLLQILLQCDPRQKEFFLSINFSETTKSMTVNPSGVPSVS